MPDEGQEVPADVHSMRLLLVAGLRLATATL